MMVRRFLGAVAAMALMCAGVAACSSADGSAGTIEVAGSADSPAARSDGVVASSDVENDEPTPVARTGGEGSDRPFGSSRDTIALALQKATDADSFKVDSDTIRLVFVAGSTQDVKAHTTCRVAGHLTGDSDRVLLVFPDGERDCGADPAAQDPQGDGTDGPGTGDPTAVATGGAEPAEAAGKPAGTGSATVTIGDRSWSFDGVVCAMGEAQTGVAGSEFNMAAGNGGFSLYAAIDAADSYIELSDTSEAESVNYYGSAARISVTGRTVTGEAMFTDFLADGAEPLSGKLTASCP